MTCYDTCCPPGEFCCHYIFILTQAIHKFHICFSVVYQVGLGNESGVDNIVPLTNVSHETTTYCFDNLALEHIKTYFTMVTAWNGGHIEKSATAVSDGGKIGRVFGNPTPFVQNNSI